MLKDPLDYSDEELKSLSKDDLKQLLDTCESNFETCNVNQLSLKILINSLYGACGKEQFVFFNERIAQAITGNGRYFIKKLANNINAEFNKSHTGNFIIYGDTDSVYFSIKPFVEDYKAEHPQADINELVDFALEFNNTNVNKIIDDTINEFATELNAYDASTIGAKAEICADTGIFIAKKRYVLRVREDEGTRFALDHPKIKTVGIEIARSSTPSWIRSKLKEAIPILLDKSFADVRTWFLKTKEEYMSQPVETLAISGAVTSLDYNIKDSSIPIGSRSVLVYNKFVEDNNLTNKYPLIPPGEKSKRLYLKTPNKFNSDTIAFTNPSFIKEFKDYIDYDKNFEKTFISPLSIMTTPLKYDITLKTDTLEDW